MISVPSIPNIDSYQFPIYNTGSTSVTPMPFQTCSATN